MTIEAAVRNGWPSGSPNLLHYRSFEGYCENIPQGRVTAELWVGKCPGVTPGSAYTGWKCLEPNPNQLCHFQLRTAVEYSLSHSFIFLDS